MTCLVVSHSCLIFKSTVLSRDHLVSFCLFGPVCCIYNQSATEISFFCKCFDQWQHRLAMLTALLYCDWLKVIQKDKLCITLACWSTRRKSNGLEIIIRSYSTDKRTDDWSRDSGLWTVVLSGLWNKRVWATFEARFFTFSRSIFFYYYFY